MAYVSKEKAISAIGKRPLSSVMFNGFREDLDFARNVLEYNVSSIKHLGNRIKENYGFASIVCSEVPWLIEYFSDKIRNDPMFVKAVILKKLNDSNTYGSGVEAFKTNHHEIVMPVLSQREKIKHTITSNG